jgi:hypothetical protein
MSNKKGGTNPMANTSLRTLKNTLDSFALHNGTPSALLVSASHWWF